MANTTKPMSEKDFNQVMRSAFNDEDKTLSTSSFVSGKVGHKITLTVVSTTVDDFRYLDAVNTKTGSLSSGSPIVQGLSNTNELSVGQYVYHADVPANTKILSIDSLSQITLTNNATNTTSASLQFANLLYRIQIVYTDASHSTVSSVERVE